MPGKRSATSKAANVWIPEVTHQNLVLLARRKKYKTLSDFLRKIQDDEIKRNQPLLDRLRAEEASRGGK